MLSVTDSMQVTEENSHKREQCVPGAPSDFSSVWERGYAQTHTVQDMFWPTPGLISCTGHTHAANEIT